MIIEKDIERKLVKLVESEGGMCLKWTCPGWRGVPDRLCILPGGHVVFVETKRPKGGVLSPLQKWWRDRLLHFGCLYFIVGTEEDLQIMKQFLGIWRREGFKEEWR